MELKQFWQPDSVTILFLLIVPYGIETLSVPPCTCRRWLLIVPYGIETEYYDYLATHGYDLLIVPYGIET